MEAGDITRVLELDKETSVVAFLDLSNMFHWQDTLHWQFSVYAVIGQLLEIPSIKEVRVYYGLNEHEPEKSKRFHRRLRECGAILITKPVKWIQKTINKELFVKYPTLARLDHEAHIRLDDFINYLNEKGISIEEPKCNFDVEMALDILDSAERVHAFFFSPAIPIYMNPSNV